MKNKDLIYQIADEKYNKWREQGVSSNLAQQMREDFIRRKINAENNAKTDSSEQIV